MRTIKYLFIFVASIKNPALATFREARRRFGSSAQKQLLLRGAYKEESRRQVDCNQERGNQGGATDGTVGLDACNRHGEHQSVSGFCGGGFAEAHPGGGIPSELSNLKG